jgi:hypothetical protein
MIDKARFHVIAVMRDNKATEQERSAAWTAFRETVKEIRT